MPEQIETLNNNDYRAAVATFLASGVASPTTTALLNWSLDMIRGEHAVGIEVGRAEGYRDGYIDGYSQGYTDGLTDGYDNARSWQRGRGNDGH